MKSMTLWLTMILLACCPVCQGMAESPEDAVETDVTPMVSLPSFMVEEYRSIADTLDLVSLVQEGYFGEVAEEDLLEGAVAGMLASLGDPYTFYYTPEAYAEIWEEDEGEYAGIGILISANYQSQICTCIRTFTGSPAEAAGVRRGDILYMVEDMKVNADNLTEAVDIMRGTPGTDVHVTFLRDGEEIHTTITRAIINVTRVEWGVLEDNIGYICLYEFAGDCAEKFQQAVDELTAQNVQGIIIDLRDNPGGWVDAAQSMADIFLDEGLIFYSQYKDGYQERAYSKDGKVDLPLVILVNENSASSSEILTGALQDRANATVVGVQSYGKGIIQAVMPLGTEGAGMQITFAQYFTPNGNAVHGIGITPDITVELDENDDGIYEFGDLADPQLHCAVETMQKKIAAQ